MKEPVLIKAGSNLIRLGENCSQPPKVDCRVVAEDYYQQLINKSKVEALIEKWEKEEVSGNSFSKDYQRLQQYMSELKELINPKQ
jgi:hypothetical protein